MTNANLEKLIWVLIFGGLFLLVIGIFVAELSPLPGWAIGVIGGVGAVVGAVLIWVRSRRPA